MRRRNAWGVTLKRKNLPLQRFCKGFSKFPGYFLKKAERMPVSIKLLSDKSIREKKIYLKIKSKKV